MKRGVFSKLYRDAVLLVTHSNDQDYERILFLLLYELLQQYLLLQSSQWHTIVSKQFYLYEETGKEPSDKADGVETIVYLLQFVLFHLPGLEVTLSGNTVEENILAYFCTTDCVRSPTSSTRTSTCSRRSPAPPAPALTPCTRSSTRRPPSTSAGPSW